MKDRSMYTSEFIEMLLDLYEKRPNRFLVVATLPVFQKDSTNNLSTTKYNLNYCHAKDMGPLP
ncbi:protein of unknown function [Nitrosotalea devaniterrae]|uniref:Uncharacterized protein n=1 Tax=Nitrosotalea devaniterrae TaxID=1078905 RepID=A0A128A5L3_9ARCH|nr:protein of unknown function [Candidatus Nitrosotalea devanaterra]